MAKVTNAFDTYTATANREDLSDVIYNIDPMDTPFMTLAQTRNVSNVTFDWQTEELPAVNKSNAEVEGFELSRSAGTATSRPTNVCQISFRDATVTGSQEAGNPAGKRSEMAHQMALAGKALKRDMESILCGEQGRTDGAAATARTTRALESWIATNVDREGTGANAADENSSPTDGVQRALTEEMLKDVLQACYENGAEPSVLLVGPYNKRVTSDFTGRDSARQQIGPTQVQQSVTLYASDFGDIRIAPSRWIRARTAFLLDPEFVAVAYYRRMRRQDIAKIGDAKTQMIVTEYGLEMRNEAAHGVIADLTTSA